VKQQLVSFVFLELAFDRLMFALNLKQDNIKSKRSKRTILQLLTITLLSSMYLKLAFQDLVPTREKWCGALVPLS
jgi:putative copper export protein